MDATEPNRVSDIVLQKPWNTVATEMGNKYTEDGCRMLFNRFIIEVDKGEE